MTKNPISQPTSNQSNTVRNLLLLVTGIVVIFVLILAVRWGFGVLGSLIGSGKQLVVAAVASSVMAVVGFGLTMGQGNLARAGQYEKISVWAALVLSVVSSITTSLGLLGVLAQNSDMGEILQVCLALFLGVGIQLSMLMYALRIGDAVMRLTPVVQSFDDEEIEDDAQSGHRPIAWVAIFSVVIVGSVGIAMLSGVTAMEYLWSALRALYTPGQQNNGYFLGGLVILGAILLAVRYRLLIRPGTAMGLVMSIGIYTSLLMFSSGFGYLSYFLAAQKNEVLATDRDSVIRTDSSALIRKIRDAAQEDVREALIEARSGQDYNDLTAEIDDLARLFVANRALLDDQVRANQARYENLKAERDRALTSVDDANTALEQAKLVVAQKNREVTQATNARDRRMVGLTKDLAEAEKKRDDAAAGRDGTDEAICGKNCKKAQKRMDDIQSDMDQLDSDVLDAENEVKAAETEVKQAERALKDAQTGQDGTNLEIPLPRVVAGIESFTQPRNEYLSNPSIDGLKTIASTCITAREMLLNMSIGGNQMPSCEIARVEAWLIRHAERQKAMETMVTPCKRTDKEITAEAEALQTAVTPDIDKIEPYLRTRLGWVSRCLTAANTGSERMNAVAVEANRLVSEYATTGYDPRRALRSLTEGNLWSIFSLLMAIVVDTAILFAGFAANSYRGREMGEDPAFVNLERISESIYNALVTVDPEEPHRAALRIAGSWAPRPAEEIGNSPFTHKLILADPPGPEEIRIRLVLDAAGPNFARYTKGKMGNFWLLHTNLKDQILSHATSSAAKTKPYIGDSFYKGDQAQTGIMPSFQTANVTAAPTVQTTNTTNPEDILPPDAKRD